MTALIVDTDRAGPQEQPPPASARAHARKALPSLCEALGLGARTQEALDLFALMTEPWGDRPLGDATRGGLADDPYAFSLAFGAGEGELRIFVEPVHDGAASGPKPRAPAEPQADEPLAPALWAAGRALGRRLAERHGVSLDALGRVEDLFEPAADGRMAMRYAAVLRGSAPPRFEVILDAQARGRWKAAASVEEALVRLGFDRAWPSLAEGALRRGAYLDELRYFSVDLPATGTGEGPVVRVIVQHHDATAGDLRVALGDSPLAARAEELCLAMTGSPGPYRAGPLVSSHTFRGPGARVPSSGALHVPVAAYGRSDAVIRGRVSAYLSLLDHSPDGYERALGGYARRPLGARAGLQSHVGLREDESGLSVSIDLSPDLRAAPLPVSHSVTLTPPTPTPKPPAQPADLPPPEEIVHRFEDHILLADHPFLRRVAREPVHLGHLWLVVRNFWEGIVQHFPKRLSHAIAAIDDDRIRCVLTKQLNDELGEGKFDRAHKAMFRTFVEAVEPFRLDGPDDVLLEPGRAFGRELEAVIFSDDPCKVVGGFMMIETYGEQTDRWMGGQFRRQDRIDLRALHWLHLHEGLELEHAKDSLTLAHCVPRDAASVAAAWQGAEAIVTAGRHYFDAFYRICFG